MSERKPTGCAILNLPLPVSSNRIWRNIVVNGKPRTLKSAEYRAWQQEAGLVLNAQRPGRVEGPFCLTISVSTKWRCDLDNCIKATSDLLQSNGVIANDKHAQKIIVERANVEGMRVMVASTKGEANEET